MNVILTFRNKTLKFYNENAEEYARRRPGKRHLAKRQSFIELLPKGASILDLGCGAGHDAQAFLRAGMNVELLDYSEALSSQCQKLTEKAVILSRIEDIDYENFFDAIWASASLLHLSDAALVKAFSAIYRSLRPTGIFMCSFKEGAKDWLDENERFFVAMTESKLSKLAQDSGFEAVCIDRSEPDITSRSQATWLWLLASKSRE